MASALREPVWAVIDTHDDCRGIDLTHDEARALVESLQGNATIITSDSARRLHFTDASEATTQATED